MKRLIFFLFILIPEIHASTFCMHHWQRHKETGKYQMHHMQHIKCSCPCTAPRNNDGSCQQCGHKVKVQPLHIKRKLKTATN